MTWRIEQGHVLDVLKAMDAESVDCVVTSPPYWGLRAYSTEPQVWGGLPDRGCEASGHHWGDTESAHRIYSEAATIHGKTSIIGSQQQDAQMGRADKGPGSICGVCGAWRGELGSEPTIALFIEHLMMVFDEVRRVMKPTATLWVNLGDSYAGSGKGPSKSLQPDASQIGAIRKGSGRADGIVTENSPRNRDGVPATDGLKAKDLCLIPERFALAMQDRGWWVRSRIAWCKTSAMPESVTDRPTSAWEHIWLFSKAAKYFYDADAVRTPGDEWLGRSGTFARDGLVSEHVLPGQTAAEHRSGRDDRVPAGANLRNYWLLGPDPFSAQRLGGGGGGTNRIASPDCPVHGSLASRAAWERHDERSAASPSGRSPGTDDRPSPGLFGEFLSTDAEPQQAVYDESAAKVHSRRKSKTDSLLSPHGTDDGESPLRTEYTEGEPENYASADRTPESKNGQGDLDDHQPARTSIHTIDMIAEEADAEQDEGSRDDEQRTSWSNTAGDFGPDGEGLGPSEGTGPSTKGKCTCGIIDHYAVFPREIPKLAILAGSRVGDMILDPFAGSGTTLFVAEENGRDSIGIELQPSYIKLAEKRMRSARTPLPGLLS